VTEINGKVPEPEQVPAEPQYTPTELAVNRLCRFKTVLARWQLGLTYEQQEFDAICDTRALLLILRAEVNALLSVLVETRIVKHSDFDKALEEAANRDNTNLSLRFPGYYGTDEGLAVDLKIAVATAKRYGFNEPR
jgi:hypothetical protein